MGQWCFLRNSNNRRTGQSILLVKKFLGLVEITSGLVNASFSLPQWQAAKMIFFAPWCSCDQPIIIDVMGTKISNVYKARCLVELGLVNKSFKSGSWNTTISIYIIIRRTAWSLEPGGRTNNKFNLKISNYKVEWKILAYVALIGYCKLNSWHPNVHWLLLTKIIASCYVCTYIHPYFIVLSPQGFSESMLQQ